MWSSLILVVPDFDFQNLEGMQWLSMRGLSGTQLQMGHSTWESCGERVYFAGVVKVLTITRVSPLGHAS